jgi:RNA polymerase sigma-70 factor (ECF subfamily)
LLLKKNVSFLLLYAYGRKIPALHQTEKEITEEQKLLGKAKESPAYFAPLYEKYFRRIFLFIYRRTENESVAGDITSQVFLKALLNLSSYKFKGLPFSAWLFRVAVNEVNEYYRKSKKERIIFFEDEELKKLELAVKEEEKPSVSDALLFAALENLSEDEMTLIELRFFEKRSFREIAYILNITEINSKTKTYRVLEKLKKIISGLSKNGKI